MGTFTFRNLHNFALPRHSQQINNEVPLYISLFSPNFSLSLSFHSIFFPYSATRTAALALSSTNFTSSEKLVMSGIMPPLQYVKILSPTRSFSKSAGSLAPPCCNNLVLRAVPVVNDSGSSWHSFCQMVAAKHLAYK